MNKNEFLHALCEKLKEGLTTSQMEEHIHYYNDYINQEISGGKSEVEVIESLGDPILLARTILEAPGTESHEGVYQEEPSENIYKDDGKQQGIPFQINQISGWGCIAIAVAAMMVIGLVLWLFGVVVRVFMPVIVPILIILFVVAIFKQRR